MSAHLVDLEEHNDKRKKMHADDGFPKRNGIACPNCQHELMDKNAAILTSIPPQRTIICSNEKCGYTGFRIV